MTRGSAISQVSSNCKSRIGYFKEFDAVSNDIDDFELKHKAIIDRFGRYPHRNEMLGRDSTADEIAFLKEPDSSF